MLLVRCSLHWRVPLQHIAPPRVLHVESRNPVLRLMIRRERQIQMREARHHLAKYHGSAAQLEQFQAVGVEKRSERSQRRLHVRDAEARNVRALGGTNPKPQRLAFELERNRLLIVGLRVANSAALHHVRKVPFSPYPRTDKFSRSVRHLQRHRFFGRAKRQTRNRLKSSGFHEA